jgi:hypothetical protein
MKEIKQSVLPAGSINKSRVVTVYEASPKGVIISRAQFEQMPEEFRTQVQVINKNANEVTLEAEFSVIDEIIAWTVDCDIPHSTGIELLMR